MSRPQNPPSEKETLLARFLIQIKVKKKTYKVNRANVFGRKKLKQTGVPKQFFPMADFRDVVPVVSVLSYRSTNKDK